MPTNVGPKYLAAEKKYYEARTEKEKLTALKEMLATVPKHKGTERLQLQIKRKIAELQKEIEKEKKAGKKKSFTIKKEGAATVAFIGVLNSGKTRLFCKLTGDNYEGENNYEIKMRMIPFENIWLQGLDLPAFHANFANSTIAGQVFNLIRNSDVIVIVANDEKEIQFLQSILEKANIKISQKKMQTFEKTELPAIATMSDIVDTEQFKQQIWMKAGKIRVQTKTSEKIAEKPIVLKEGATVRDLATAIHQDFVRNFKYAKVWGKSAKFPGQALGMSHKLLDKDIVEIFTK
ncbi:MAG: TGS domain-containing protein [Candidatus Nanoarchaeia archaeon]